MLFCTPCNQICMVFLLAAKRFRYLRCSPCSQDFLAHVAVAGSTVKQKDKRHWDRFLEKGSVQKYLGNKASRDESFSRSCKPSSPMKSSVKQMILGLEPSMHASAWISKAALRSAPRNTSAYIKTITATWFGRAWTKCPLLFGVDWFICKHCQSRATKPV